MMKIWNKNRSIVIVLCCVLFFSCNKKEIETNRRTAEVTIYTNDLASYVTFDTLVKVENLKTKKILFQKKINCEQLIVPTVLVKKHNYLYFPLNDSVLSCVNFKTEKEIWKYKFEDVITGLKNVNDSIILVDLRDAGVVALNIMTGKRIYEIKDSNNSRCNSPSVHNIVFDEKYFWVSDFDCGTVTAFNLKDGKEVWKYKSKINGAVRLLLTKDYVFCGITGNPMNKEGAVFLIDKKSGTLVFAKPEQFDLITKPVNYKNKVIYYGYNSKLSELDLDTKTIKVIKEFNEDELSCGNQLFLLDNTLYFDDCRFNINQLNLISSDFKVLGKSGSNLLGVYKKGKVVEFIY